MELFNEKGDVVEAFSEEEVQQKIEEQTTKAIEDATTANQEEVDEFKAKLEAAETAKTELEEKIAKIDDKTANFKNLRSKVDDKDSVISELKETIDKLQQTTEEKFEELKTSSQKKIVDSLINKVAGGDEELLKKMNLYYGRFNVVPKNEEELTQLVNDAYLLSTGGTKKNLFTGDVLSSAGGTPPNVGKGEEKISEGSHDVADKMGVTPQLLKKHKLI